MTCPDIALGAYVLGALDADERIELERHLDDCTSCRDELSQFAKLPALLQTLTLEEVTAVPVAKPRRTFSRRGALIATAAAISVAFAGILAGRELGANSAQQAGVSWSATDGVGGIDITARLSNQSWGTDIQLQMKELEPGQLCKLVVHSRSGGSETTGWWATNDLDEADVPASTSIALSDIDRLDIVTAAGTVLTSLTSSTR
jgi:hypothetical protein